MTTFDPTKPVRTRSGQRARIVCTDRKQHSYKIVALIGQFEETIVTYDQDGRNGVTHINSSVNHGPHLDLINVPQKHKGWVNLYRSGPCAVADAYMGCEIHRSRKDADLRTLSVTVERIACIEVEFEEGQGLDL